MPEKPGMDELLRLVHAWTSSTTLLRSISASLCGLVFVYLTVVITTSVAVQDFQPQSLWPIFFAIVYLIRKAIAFSRHHELIRQIGFEKTFIESNRHECQFPILGSRGSTFWRQSFLAQGILSTGYQPELDAKEPKDLYQSLNQVISGLILQFRAESSWKEIGFLAIWSLVLAGSSVVSNPSDLSLWIWLCIACMLLAESWMYRIVSDSSAILERIPSLASHWAVEEFRSVKPVTRGYRRVQIIREKPLKGR